MAKPCSALSACDARVACHSVECQRQTRQTAARCINAVPGLNRRGALLVGPGWSDATLGGAAVKSTHNTNTLSCISAKKSVPFANALFIASRIASVPRADSCRNMVGTAYTHRQQCHQQGIATADAEWHQGSNCQTMPRQFKTSSLPSHTARNLKRASMRCMTLARPRWAMAAGSLSVTNDLTSGLRGLAPCGKRTRQAKRNRGRCLKGIHCFLLLCLNISLVKSELVLNNRAHP